MLAPTPPREQAGLNDANASAFPDKEPSATQSCPLEKGIICGVFFDGTGNNRYDSNNSGSYNSNASYDSNRWGGGGNWGNGTRAVLYSGYNLSGEVFVVGRGGSGSIPRASAVRRASA